MSINTTFKKPKYFYLVGILVFIFGVYSSYINWGLSLAIIPVVISYLGVAFLFSEMATGNVTVINLSKWRDIEIGMFGKLALLFMAVGASTSSFVAG